MSRKTTNKKISRRAFVGRAGIGAAAFTGAAAISGVDLDAQVPLGGGTSVQKKYRVVDSPDILFNDLTDWVRHASRIPRSVRAGRLACAST